MNRFRLDRYMPVSTDDRGFTGPLGIAVPVIDDVPLHKLTDRDWPGLSVDLVAPPSRQWLGRPDYCEDGGVVVIDGTCGAPGCCGLVAAITLTESTVIWADVLTWRPPWFRYEFDRAEYERAIATIRDRPLIPFDLPD